MNETNLNLGSTPLNLGGESKPAETAQTVVVSQPIEDKKDVAIPQTPQPAPIVDHAEDPQEHEMESIVDDDAPEAPLPPEKEIPPAENITVIPNREPQQISAKIQVEKETPKKEEPVSEPEEQVDPSEGELRREFAGLFNIERQKETKTSEDAGIDTMLNAVSTGTKEDNDKVMDQFSSDAALRKAVAVPGSFMQILSEVIQYGWGSSTIQADLREILEHSETYKKLAKQPDLVRDFFTHGAKYNSDAPTSLSGKKARIAVMARMRGLQKVNFLNSGFYVILRAPQMAELQEFASSVEIEATELGHELGNHFGLVTDVFIKEKFIELLQDYNLIVDSNFADINKKGALAENLSYFDYDVAMWALVSLMYRKGLHTKIACTHCKTVSPDVLIDVLSTKWINNDLYTEEMINYWSQKTDENGRPVMRQVKDLQNYRNNIVNRTKRIIQKQDDYTLAITLRDPTMAKFISVGTNLVNDLNKTLHGPSRLREDQIKMKSIIHLFQMYAPWVAKIEFLDDNGKVMFETDDTQSIMDALDISNQKYHDLLTNISEYISEAKINHIGTFTIECPNCGAKPETKLDNFYPLDVETIFFALSCRP